MTDWQPYDTVPRDGSWLRLKGPHTKPEGERVRWERAPDVKPGGGLWINDKGWMAIYEFTHWRPDAIATLANIYPVDGGFVASVDGVWFPGCYVDRDAALRALTLDEDTIAALQDRKNAEAQGAGGIITHADLDALRDVQPG